MQLSLKESARLMNVPEQTICRWVKQGKLPAYSVNDQYRFNRAELLEWANEQQLEVSAELFAEADHGLKPTLGLAEALQAGSIHYGVPGHDKAAVLQSVVEMMTLPEEVDKEFLVQLLLGRESLGSTGLGNGIAVPHVRHPIVMRIARPMVTLCFLEHPIDFAAIDGIPVHTLFTITSPTIKAHLNLLSRLAYALRQPPFAGVIERQASSESIIEAAASVEAAIP